MTALISFIAPVSACAMNRQTLAEVLALRFLVRALLAFLQRGFEILDPFT
jgi:hypothetical protein